MGNQKINETGAWTRTSLSKQAMQASNASKHCKQAMQASNASKHCKQAMQASNANQQCKQVLQASIASKHWRWQNRLGTQAKSLRNPGCPRPAGAQSRGNSLK